MLSRIIRRNNFTNFLRRGYHKNLKLPPVKLHCSMLAEDAVKAAIEDYKKKIKQATLLLSSLNILLIYLICIMFN